MRETRRTSRFRGRVSRLMSEATRDRVTIDRRDVVGEKINDGGYSARHGSTCVSSSRARCLFSAMWPSEGHSLLHSRLALPPPVSHRASKKTRVAGEEERQTITRFFVRSFPCSGKKMQPPRAEKYAVMGFLRSRLRASPLRRGAYPRATCVYHTIRSRVREEGVRGEGVCTAYTSVCIRLGRRRRRLNSSRGEPS